MVGNEENSFSLSSLTMQSIEFVVNEFSCHNSFITVVCFGPVLFCLQSVNQSNKFYSAKCREQITSACICLQSNYWLERSAVTCIVTVELVDCCESCC